MEISGIIIIILVITVFYLFIKATNLEIINQEFQKKNMKKNFFVLEQVLSIDEDYYVDGDDGPLIIPNCVIAYHRDFPKVKWTGDVRFYASREPIRGHQLHEKLHLDSSLEVLNGNFLDFLIKHPELIPANWPTFISFFGTVYRQISDGRCFVRCLVKKNDNYVVENHWLDANFDAIMPVIIK